MASFGRRSHSLLDTCHPDLRRLMREVVVRYDCSITQGHRPPSTQAALVASGRSKVKRSKHNELPSDAVHARPYPINWDLVVESDDILAGLHPDHRAALKERMRLYHFAGYTQAIAEHQGKPVRWGGDWDGDREVNDQNFDDLEHFERERTR